MLSKRHRVRWGESIWSYLGFDCWENCGGECRSSFADIFFLQSFLSFAQQQTISFPWRRHQDLIQVSAPLLWYVPNFHFLFVSRENQDTLCVTRISLFLSKKWFIGRSLELLLSPSALCMEALSSSYSRYSNESLLLQMHLILDISFFGGYDAFCSVIQWSTFNWFIIIVLNKLLCLTWKWISKTGVDLNCSSLSLYIIIFLLSVVNKIWYMQQFWAYIQIKWCSNCFPFDSNLITDDSILSFI